MKNRRKMTVAAAVILAAAAAACLGAVIVRKEKLKNADNELVKERAVLDAVFPEKEAEILPLLPDTDGGPDSIPEAGSAPAELFGRLTVPGTDLDLPVMMPDENDPDKYLHRDMYGKESLYGSVYADTAAGPEAVSLVLYGHHMKNGAMFGILENYLDESWCENHRELILRTRAGTCRYAPSAVIRFSPDDPETAKALSFVRPSDPQYLAGKAREIGKLYSVPEGEKHLVLVTCEYSAKDGKLAVIFDLKE